MIIPSDSYDYAKKHIEKFYDSDFFPKPFEYFVLFKYWDEVKDYLSKTDTSDMTIESPITFAVPKHSKGFRIAHQLDPINSIVYTALAHHISEEIEKIRAPIEEKVACSYRIKLDDNGNFFEKGTGYKDFIEKSLDLSKEFNFVLQADITDFYSQIYLHRLQNSIELSPVLKEVSKTIENFLMDLNNKVSKGIPVGPAASIIMAEALLIDIDQFVENKGFKYTRYVDDFRFFSDTKEELIMLEHDLTQYLYHNHRLTLEGSKTKLTDTDYFVENYLQDPEIVERDKVEEEIDKLNEKVHNFYWEFEEDFEEEIPDQDKINADKIKAQGEAFKYLMKEILDKPYFDLGLARHILRRSKALRSRAIITQLLDNIDYFAPVIRDVVLYLNSVTNKTMIEMNIDKFLHIINNSEALKYPYFKLWVEYYFASHELFALYPDIKKFILGHGNIRNQALFAENTKNISWVREYRNRVSILGPWERRSIIYSSKILSNDERIKWMEYIEKNNPSFLEKIIIKYVKSI